MKWNRLWLMGLGIFTAGVLVISSGFPTILSTHYTSVLELPAQAQSSKPDSKASPSSAVKETVPASPKPAPDQAIPANPPPNITPLPLSDAPYQDPAKEFEVGIIQDYKVTKVAGISMLESPDGNLAYSVMVKPQATLQALDNNTLAQFAVSQLDKGEGFKPNIYQTTSAGGILIPWTGTLTQGRNSQPMNGIIWAVQNQRNVFLVVISATEAGTEQVPQAFKAISNSFKAL